MPNAILWTSQEDEKLRQLVAEFGDKRWSLIADRLGTSKGSKQCRRRWKNCLSLEVKKGSWSKEEDDILREAHAVHGNRWTLIAKLVGGRTDNAVKNRWAALSRRKASGSRRVRRTLLSNASKDNQPSGIELGKGRSARPFRVQVPESVRGGCQEGASLAVDLDSGFLVGEEYDEKPSNAVGQQLHGHDLDDVLRLLAPAQASSEGLHLPLNVGLTDHDVSPDASQEARSGAPHGMGLYIPSRTDAGTIERTIRQIGPSVSAWTHDNPPIYDVEMGGTSNNSHSRNPVARGAQMNGTSCPCFTYSELDMLLVALHNEG